jgi:hypothetical protein
MQLLYGRLGEKDIAEVVSAVQAAGVAYEMGSGGTSVYVPADAVHKLRIQLASKGVPSGEGVGFEVFDRANELRPESGLFGGDLGGQCAKFGELGGDGGRGGLQLVALGPQGSEFGTHTDRRGGCHGGCLAEAGFQGGYGFVFAGQRGFGDGDAFVGIGELGGETGPEEFVFFPGGGEFGAEFFLIVIRFDCGNGPGWGG